MNTSGFLNSIAAAVVLTALTTARPTQAERLVPWPRLGPRTMSAVYNQCKAEKRALQRAKSKLRQATAKQLKAERKVVTSESAYERAQDQYDRTVTLYADKEARTREGYQRDLDRADIQIAEIQLQIDVLMAQGCNPLFGCDQNYFNAQLEALRGRKNIAIQSRNNIVQELNRAIIRVSEQRTRALAPKTRKLQSAQADMAAAQTGLQNADAVLAQAEAKYEAAADAYDACA